VEVWDHDTESGVYTSTAIAPRLTSFETEGENGRPERNYLAFAPGGRLMVVSKHVRPTKNERYRLHARGTCMFTVHVLCDDGRWKETRDIGDSAVFVGLNNSLCVPVMGRPEMEAGCIYFTDDELWEAEIRRRNKPYIHKEEVESNDHADVYSVGVYSLKDGTVKKIEGLNRQQYRSFNYTLPAWITPSIP
jgi:hypothetical protein